MRAERIAAMLLIMTSGACSSDSSPSADQGPGMEASGGTASLSGFVRDPASVPVSGARVEVAPSASVYSDKDGRYQLTGLASGTATVKVSQDWFQPADQQVQLTANAAATLDITLTERPLQIDAADKTLAESYAKTFDWSKSKLSIAMISGPTRSRLDSAIYYQNPALYRDPTGKPQVVPATPPSIDTSGAKGFDFPLAGGAAKGEQALEPASIVDKLEATPLTDDEKSEIIMFRPMRNWLSSWDAEKSAELSNLSAAVQQQTWGASQPIPQTVDRAFLHGKELWVTIAFEPFVQVGAGVADDDHDGRPEVYARVSSKLYSDEILAKLRDDYLKRTFNTHGLSKEIGSSLNELYSTTAAQVLRHIGEPFEASGVGTIKYPFVVLQHSGGQQNVLLVGP